MGRLIFAGRREERESGRGQARTVALRPSMGRFEFAERDLEVGTLALEMINLRDDLVRIEVELELQRLRRVGAGRQNPADFAQGEAELLAF